MKQQSKSSKNLQTQPVRSEINSQNKPKDLKREQASKNQLNNSQTLSDEMLNQAISEGQRLAELETILMLKRVSMQRLLNSKNLTNQQKDKA